MADKILSQRSKLGHTFINAMWILGFLAFLQLVAVSWILLSKDAPAPRVAEASPTELSTTSLPVTPEPPTPDRLQKQAASAPVTEPPKLKDDSLDAIRKALKAQPNRPIKPTQTLNKLKQMAAPNLSHINDTEGVIDDALIERLVQGGINDRQRGNLQAALSSLLDADQNLPDHPRIMAEIAGTYGEMGQLKQAEQFWTRVRSSSYNGGQFFGIADSILKGKTLTTVKFEPGLFIKLGKIVEQRQPLSADGELVTLSVPILGNQSENLEETALNLQTYFYDQVNHQTFAPTVAKISYKFPSAPYNWQEGSEEIIQVIYHLPASSVEQTATQGERRYFGYDMELFYQNQLQSRALSSEALRNARSLKPTIPTPPPPPRQSVDSSLFPRNR